MIRINLLAEGKRPVAVRRTRSSAPVQREWAIWCLVGVFLLGALLLAGWWWKLNSTIEDNKQAIARAEEEVRALEAVLKEVEDYKRKEAELEHKIAIIEQLRANQTGPVRVMDEISRALPELLWIDRMQVGATSITLTGRAFNSNAVANFIENLDRVDEFQEPVLRDLQERGPVYVYTIVFNYSYLKPTEETDDDASDSVAAGG